MRRSWDQKVRTIEHLIRCARNVNPTIRDIDRKGWRLAWSSRDDRCGGGFSIVLRKKRGGSEHTMYSNEKFDAVCAYLNGLYDAFYTLKYQRDRIKEANKRRISRG